jgi:membrane-associated phospholipid phosphatase
MTLNPTQFDVDGVTGCLQLMGKHPLFDRAVQSCLRHGVLGGLWFSIAVFLLWAQSMRSGDEKIRARIVTTLLATFLAAVTVVSLGAMLKRTAPNDSPGLQQQYPEYIDRNESSSCFPSYSVAFLVPVAAGVFSVRRWWGMLLWIAIPLLVALPRIYVGGHYPTDVMAGFVVGIIAYLVARRLEARISRPLARFFERHGWITTAANLVLYAWVLETAFDFREAGWIRDSVADMFFR